MIASPATLGSTPPNARKVHVDIDASEINKIIRVDVGIVGDLRTVIEGWLPELVPVDRSSWVAYVTHLQVDASARDIQHVADNGQLYAAHVIAELSRLTDGRAVIVTDVGQHQMWEAQYYKHESRRSLITSGGLGTMGFALPAAIGAKMACPDREVWVVVGDGGFQMTMAELATIVQEDLDINIAIINNRHLGMVRQLQHFFYEKRFVAVPVSGPDFVKLADAYGLWGAAVERRSDVAATMSKARTHGGATVIDFRVAEEDMVYPHVKAGAALHEMFRRPMPFVETALD